MAILRCLLRSPTCITVIRQFSKKVPFAGISFTKSPATNFTTSIAASFHSTSFRNSGNHIPLVSHDDKVKQLEMATKEEAVAIAKERLAALTPAEQRQLQILKMEYEVMISTGEKVPEEMDDVKWVKIFDCNGNAGRKRLYRYFLSVEKSKQRKLREKEKKQKERSKLPEAKEEDKLEGDYKYGAGTKNTILLRILKPTMNKHYHNNIYNSLLYGQKLVFDMSWDDYMRHQDITNLVDQLLECHGHNKVHKDPFYFYFCNFKEGSQTYNKISKASVGTELQDFPFTVTEKSYLDLFPKEDLVYLTPNAPTMLEKFDPDKVHIIGGLVDKVVTQPITMAKAKKEGIKMAKLPTDLYVKFVAGSKSLTLDQMVRILLDVKVDNNWREAFKYLPRRKVIPLDTVLEAEQEKARNRAQKMYKHTAFWERSRSKRW